VGQTGQTVMNMQNGGLGCSPDPRPGSRDSKVFIRAGLPRDLEIEIVDLISRSIRLLYFIFPL
jgi:hypothetical protein